MTRAETGNYCLFFGLRTSEFEVRMSRVQLRRFAHRRFFAMHSCEMMALAPSGNRETQIVYSQDDAVAGLLRH